MKVIFSAIVGAVLSVIFWFWANFDNLVAYANKELGVIPMLYLNNSFDNYLLGGLLIGAVLGLKKA